MTLTLLVLPFLMALAAWCLPSDRGRIWLLPAGAALFACAALQVAFCGAPSAAQGWIGWDPAGRLVLLVVALLDLAVAFYLVAYLRHRAERPNRAFVVCVLCLPGALALVAGARHLGLLWVAVEATALCTAPLIYFNKTPRSIEATWKYLLIGFVGIAMALLGTLFLAYASLHAGLEPTLEIDALLRRAPSLSKPWLRAAFVLVLVGYGTKMGLAPMHTWKPDAYGEAPGAVGALLAGAVTAGGFLGLLRMVHLCTAAGEFAFISPLLLGIGLLSMAVAGVFLTGQRDGKRMLAYSSVEHMGLLAIGLGFGRPALFGTLLHLLNNGLTKGVLFLAAGNLHRSYGSSSAEVVRGALRRTPFTALLFLGGFLAITGSPPFGLFLSEFAIVLAGFQAGHPVLCGGVLLLLLIVFVGMGATVLDMVQGDAPAYAPPAPWQEGALTLLPPALLLALVLWFGLQLPAPLARLLDDAVRFLEGVP